MNHRGTDLILTAASGYQPQQLELFVLSALQNTSAEIALIVQNTDQALIRWLHGHQRLHLHTIRAEPEPKQLAVTRFFHALEICRRYNPTRILLTDSRDVFFQSDPFRALDPSKGLSPSLLFAAEPKSIAACSINQAWIQQFFGADTLQDILTNPVLCVGTMLGAAGAMQTFLEQFTLLIRQVIERHGSIAWGLDQAALNVLIHRGLYEQPYALRSNAEGPFATLYHQEQLLLDRRGRILTQNQQPVAIVHQYDRLPWLTAHLRSLLLLPGT